MRTAGPDLLCEGGEAAAQGQTQAQEKALPSMGGALSEDKILSQQPVSVQAVYQNLPKTAQKAILQKGSMQ